ncbi:MAG TPA: hypothetical protein VIJ15_08325 [Dermatophilaceae bacterium]
MKRFAGIDPANVTTQTMMDVQARMPTQGDRDEFALEYLTLEGIWEAAYPDERLHQQRAAYKFLAQVYAMVQPSDGKDALLWQRLGAKTLTLVHGSMSDIKVTGGADVVVADADTIKNLIDEGLIDDASEVEHKTSEEIIDSIAERLKKRMNSGAGKSVHPVYKSLAERLDRLRELTLAAADQSIEWLREAFTLAKDVTAAEKADDEGGLDLLPDPNVGALTQIFNEYAPQDAPEMIRTVVLEIDEIVKQVRFDGWASTQKGDRVVRREVRNVLKKFLMHNVPGLFDRAYEYRGIVQRAP